MYFLCNIKTQAMCCHSPIHKHKRARGLAHTKKLFIYCCSSNLTSLHYSSSWPDQKESAYTRQMKKMTRRRCRESVHTTHTQKTENNKACLSNLLNFIVIKVTGRSSATDNNNITSKLRVRRAYVLRVKVVARGIHLARVSNEKEYIHFKIGIRKMYLPANHRPKAEKTHDQFFLRKKNWK